MARALVLVGVARTGGRFPELPAVPGAVAAVRTWATEQGVPDDLVLTFTDDDGSPVTSGDVLAGVRALVDRGDVDQLVVYFSGHGINTGNAEFWLLTGAPEDGSQAVNVSLTSWFAERLPVRHVVLVSDACRTAASTVQELSVQGVAVVPNLPPRGPAAAVDVFYACALGDPAYEVKDPAASGAAYQALFTSALVGALRGDHPALVTPGTGAGFGLVQPWPLKRALPSLVAERLTAAHAPLDLAQTPDARLSSDPLEAWLSRLEPWPLAGGSPEVAGAVTERVVLEAAPADAAGADAAGAEPARAEPAPPDMTAAEATAAANPAVPPVPAARAAAAEAADRLVLGLAVGLAAGASGLPATAVG
ncbi:caspase family protein, partial [Cellulomonas sp. IC4_254]|nr:caspase family protein [Cellulomonas sp. IC4_254]